MSIGVIGMMCKQGEYLGAVHRARPLASSVTESDSSERSSGTNPRELELRVRAHDRLVCISNAGSPVPTKTKLLHHFVDHRACRRVCSRYSTAEKYEVKITGDCDSTPAAAVARLGNFPGDERSNGA